MRRFVFAALLAAFAAHAEERTVVPAARGANRLDPDVALLAHAKPGLGDLRLHDAQGREVPYLVIDPPERIFNWKDGALLPVAATKKTSGFELDLGRAMPADRIRLGGIAAPFLKRLRLEGSGDRAHWTVLAEEATVFDLPEEKLRNTEVAFTPGDYRYLRVTWDDRSSAHVTATDAAARMHIAGTAPEPMRVPVEFRRRTSEPGKSRYKLQLPGPHLPIVALELEVAGGDVFREATVNEARLANAEVVPVKLGSATVKRAQRDGAVAADLAIPIAAPDGPDLELVVDNANNPPLALTGIVARLEPQPWIYFESADGAQLTARYGNEKLNAPRYDLEASRKAASQSDPPRAHWLGDARASKNGEGAEAPLPLAGGPVNREEFRIARPVPPSRGLTTLVLDADALSRSNGLSDLRIADGSGNQVPYLVERRDEPLAISLLVPRRTANGSTSIYSFPLPYDTLPNGTRIVFTTNGRVFQRTVNIRSAGDERRGRRFEYLGTTAWTSTEPDAVPPPLTFDVPLSGVRALELEIDEGDNAPLPIASAQLLLPSFALRFYHPGAPLTLLYGNRQAAAPRYDLSLLAPRLFGQSAREVMLTAAATAPPEEPHKEQWIFWIVIGVAVLALLIILARLLGGRATTAEASR
jgi:hypothetical protein